MSFKQKLEQMEVQEVVLEEGIFHETIVEIEKTQIQPRDQDVKIPGVDTLKKRVIKKLEKKL